MMLCLNLRDRLNIGSQHFELPFDLRFTHRRKMAFSGQFPCLDRCLSTTFLMPNLLLRRLRSCNRRRAVQLPKMGKIKSPSRVLQRTVAPPMNSLLDNMNLSGRMLAFRDWLGFHSALGDHPDLDAFIADNGEKSRLLRNAYLTLADYPLLVEAAQKSSDARCLLLFAFVSYEGQQRDNRPEDIVHHTLRVAEETTDLFLKVYGPQIGRDKALEKALPVIISILVHDILENGLDRNANRIEKKLVNSLFGSEIADSADRLTVEVSGPRDDGYIDRKRAAKNVQTSILLPKELVAKIKDSLDEIRSNTGDFRNDLLFIHGDRVIFSKRQSYTNLHEFETQLNHRVTHVREYLRRLSGTEYEALIPVLNGRSIPPQKN